MLACLRILKPHLGASSYQPVSGKSLLAVVIGPLRAPESMQTPETRKKNSRLLVHPGSSGSVMQDCSCRLIQHPQLHFEGARSITIIEK